MLAYLIIIILSRTGDYNSKMTISRINKCPGEKELRGPWGGGGGRETNFHTGNREIKEQTPTR